MNQIKDIRIEISDLESKKEQSKSKKERMALNGAISVLKQMILSLKINPKF